MVSGVGEAEFIGAAHPMHLGSLIGSYAMQSTKSAPQSANKRRSVDLRRYGDGVHIWHSRGTRSSVDEPIPNPPLQATYTVNPDGTGTITHNLQTFVFVITNSHSELLVLQTHRLGDGVEYLIGHHQEQERKRVQGRDQRAPGRKGSRTALARSNCARLTGKPEVTLLGEGASVSF